MALGKGYLLGDQPCAGGSSGALTGRTRVGSQGGRGRTQIAGSMAGRPFPGRTTLWGKDDKKEDEIGFVKALGYNKRTVE